MKDASQTWPRDWACRRAGTCVVVPRARRERLFARRRIGEDVGRKTGSWKPGKAGPEAVVRAGGEMEAQTRFNRPRDGDAGMGVGGRWAHCLVLCVRRGRVLREGARWERIIVDG